MCRQLLRVHEVGGLGQVWEEAHRRQSQQTGHSAGCRPTQQRSNRLFPKARDFWESVVDSGRLVSGSQPAPEENGVMDRLHPPRPCSWVPLCQTSRESAGVPRDGFLGCESGQRGEPSSRKSLPAPAFQMSHRWATGPLLKGEQIREWETRSHAWFHVGSSEDHKSPVPSG